MKKSWGICNHYRRSISLLACGELAPAKDAQLRNHLAGCIRCREYREQITELTGALAIWKTNFDEIKPSEATLERWAAEFEAAVAKDQPSSENWLVLLVNWYRENISPYRKSWAAIETVWLILLAVNLSHEHGPKSASARKSQPSVEVVRAYLANEGFWSRPTVTERPLAHPATPRS